MQDLKDRIHQLRIDFDQALKQASNEASLEDVRLVFLSRKGHLATLMAELKALPTDQKTIVGPLLNSLKQYIEQEYQGRQQALLEEEEHRRNVRAAYFDVTAYRAPQTVGHLHIYTQIIQELEDIFLSLGFAIADGPEVETDFYNFQALNIPSDHPARDMHDTFWIHNPHVLLRTHTSPMQVRTLQMHGAPLAVFASGRTYRHESTDATHDFVFTQAEGLMVGPDISMANLLAIAQLFLQRIFNKKNLSIRVRPGYFPFVEPGVEIDFSCPFCSSGCSRCKKTGWIELLGAGLIHPAVLRASNIDPEKNTGFAFGMGVERLAMLRHGIDDIRLFHSNHLEFLNQF